VPHRILYYSRVVQIGGAEISLSHLLANLHREHFSPSLVTSFEGPLPERVRTFNVPVRIIPAPAAVATDQPKSYPTKFLLITKMLPFTVRLACLMHQEGVHLLHANDLNDALFCLLAARLARVPLLCSVRNISFTLRPEDRFLFRQVRHIIPISEAVAQPFRSLDPQGRKITVIYNGVDLRLFDRASPSPLRSDDEPGKVVGLVGRLAPDKGHRYFLEAAALVAREIPDVRFWIVGEIQGEGASFYQELRAYADTLGVGERITFTGFQSDIAAVMGALDVLVLASLAEPFGRVLIEAMAARKPVVATRAGGAVEIVSENETGLLVPPADSEALAAALLQLLHHPEWARKLGEAGRARAEALFSIESHVHKMEQLYMEVLGSRKS